jgi:hypothetical protein
VGGGGAGEGERVITAIVIVQGSVAIMLRVKRLMLNKEELRIGRCGLVGEKESHLEGQE